MPLTRYQIRNEYSLADPELYRAADKDDPEALLEGVSMAGLVGVLRQLGDLAEFAAEIFHDLHEELMATSARGHGLTVRVQQIEAEFPSIEKAFLSQSSHSSFFYNTGVDWHPNVHMGQNLVMQGDLPRFVMDSYEECRGPPRLFLLDKFDVAGAGSCLKRFTDPSFFKAESPLSVNLNAEIQREKKSRKSKKKGSRWRNRETPEVLSTSHVKLQQLFLEERVENHISDPARRVKLKRRLNGSPFGSAMGKSYMDAFLKIPTPDPYIEQQFSITSSPLKLTASVAETPNEVLDIMAISPSRCTHQAKQSMYFSSDSGAGYRPYIHELTEDYGISLKFSSVQMDDVQSTPHEVDKQEIVVDGARKTDGYQSDNEIDNYVDALTTMDSEMETDAEYKAKSEMQIMNVDGLRMGSDATEELYDIQTHSTDSQSIGNSSQMDGGNISSRKGKSSFSYSGSFDLAENVLSEGDASAKTIPSAEHCEAESVNSSSDQYSSNGNAPSTQAPRQIIQDKAGNENANTSSYINEFREPSSSSCLTESDTMLLPGDPGEHFVEVSSFGPESNEVFSNHSNSKAGFVNDEESSIHLDENIQQTSKYDDRPSQTRDSGFSELSSYSMNEPYDQDAHKSHASLHPSSILQFVSDNESTEDLRNDTLHGEYLEKENALTSFSSPDLSPTTFASHKEEFAKPENETFYPHLEPEGNASEEPTNRCSRMLDSLEAADLVEIQLQNPENDHLLGPGVGFPHVREAELDKATCSAADENKVDGLSSDNDLVQINSDSINFASEVRSFSDSPHAVDLSLGDGIKDTIHLQAKDVATAVADTNLDNNGVDATFFDPRSMKFLGDHSSVQDLHQNDMKFNDDYHHEFSMEEMVDEQAVSSELQFISSKTLPCDYSDFDLLHPVSGPSTSASSGNSLHVDKDNAITSSYQDPEDVEAKNRPNMNAIEMTEYSQSLPIHHLEEISTGQDQQIELYNCLFDRESCHDQVSEIIAVKEAEDVSSSPTNPLAEVSTTLDQKVEPQNGNLDAKSCHMTQGQVSESKYSHRTDATEEGEDVFSSNCHVPELRIPLEKKLEVHNDQFDLGSQFDRVSESTSAQHINFIENDEDSISSPTHHKAELGASIWEKDESLSDIADEPCQPKDSDSKSIQQIDTSEKTEDAVSPFTHHTIELRPPAEQKVEFQNKHFDVKSWYERSSESDHAHQIVMAESSETAVSSDIHCITESTTTIDLTGELQDHFDKNSRLAINGNTDPPLMQQGESSTLNSRERESDPSSESSVLHLPSQPSITQFLSQFSGSQPAEDPLGSKFHTLDFLPEAPLDEMPPLPPLPPMQWRLGRVQHSFPAPERNLFGHNLPSFPPLISTTKDKSQSDHPARETEISYPSNPSSRHSSLEDHNAQVKSVTTSDYGVHYAAKLSQQGSDLVTIASRMQVLTPSTVLPMDHHAKCEDVSLDSNRGTFKLSVYPFSPLTSIEDTPSALPFCYSSEKPVKPLNQSAASTSSRLDDNIQEEAVDSKERTVNIPSTIISLPVIQDYEKQPVLSTSKEQATWSSSSSVPLAPSEDRMSYGNRQIKLPRPRNPLIDAVVAHDKSKLRKVTKLPQSQTGQKAEERDSLLEQIRAKSFNLKPAAVARPSIQRPTTDIRVAAILEKANAIRQAFAGTGSDEDDNEDGWSDS